VRASVRGPDGFTCVAPEGSGQESPGITEDELVEAFTAWRRANSHIPDVLECRLNYTLGALGLCQKMVNAPKPSKGEEHTRKCARGTNKRSAGGDVPDCTAGAITLYKYTQVNHPSSALLQRILTQLGHATAQLGHATAQLGRATSSTPALPCLPLLCPAGDSGAHHRWRGDYYVVEHSS